MRIPISVAGHDAPWAFRDGEALSSWLRSRPWLDCGGVRLVSTTSPDHADLLALSSTEAAYGYDARASDLRVVDGGVADGSVRRAVADVLEVRVPPEHRDYVSCVAAVLRAHPHLLLLRPQEGQGSAWWSEAEQLVEIVAKTSPLACLSILLIDRFNARSAGLDFLVGAPPSMVMLSLHDEEDALWRAHVHARAAWEFGGSVAHARRFNDVLASVGRDDDRLENVLNDAAGHLFNMVPDRHRELLQQYLGRVVGGRDDAVARARVEDELVGTGLLWRPLGEHRLRPTPWCSRALLVGRRAPAARSFLRAALVCAPLVREILGRCFDLEARERAMNWTHRATVTAPPGAFDLWSRFAAGGDRLPAALYPTDSPAAPGDAWDFASFGEYLRATGVDSARRRALADLRDLRNALAHGHYASWKALMELRRIERQLEV